MLYHFQAFLPVAHVFDGLYTWNETRRDRFVFSTIRTRDNITGDDEFTFYKTDNSQTRFSYNNNARHTADDIYLCCDDWMIFFFYSYFNVAIIVICSKIGFVVGFLFSLLFDYSITFCWRTGLGARTRYASATINTRSKIVWYIIYLYHGDCIQGDSKVFNINFTNSMHCETFVSFRNSFALSVRYTSRGRLSVYTHIAATRTS